MSLASSIPVPGRLVAHLLVILGQVALDPADVTAGEVDAASSAVQAAAGLKKDLGETVGAASMQIWILRVAAVRSPELGQLRDLRSGELFGCGAVGNGEIVEPAAPGIAGRPVEA